MKFKPYLIVLLAALLVSSMGASPALSAPIQQEDAETAAYVEGELVIGFTHPKLGDISASSDAGFQMALMRMGGAVVEEAADNSFVLVRFRSNAEAQQAMTQLLTDSNIAYVEPNYIYSAPIPDESLLQGREGQDVGTFDYNPDDPGKVNQWYLTQILYHKAPTPAGTHPCVVLIDSGVNYNHPDLLGKIYKGRDYIQADNDPMDLFGQGTAAASIITANTNNTDGIAGISPSTKILAIRVLNQAGAGTLAQIAGGITWANKYASATKCGGQQPKIYVVNVAGPASSTLASAVNTAKAKGRLVISPAGDKNTSAKQYPAAYPAAYGVAGTEQNDRRTLSSNFDTAAAPWIDIAAPGYNIYAAKYDDNTYSYRTSTAMSASMVGAAASRVWAKTPGLTAAQVMGKITSTGDAAQGFSRAFKRLDLWGALGNNGTLILQGQVMDAFAKYTDKAMGNANVTVKSGANVICSLVTDASGYYTCQLPAKGNYTVTASKAGYITDFYTFTVSVRTYTANVALSPISGTATSDDWSISLVWKGWQPYEFGKEMDLHIVKPLAVPECSYNTNPTKYSGVETGYDSYETSQVENIRVFKSYGSTVQVWVSLWDQGPWKTASFITNSSAMINVYKNNVRVARLNVPAAPTTSRSDIWHVGNINLNTGTWQAANLIYADNAAAVPSCMYTFVDP